MCWSAVSTRRHSARAASRTMYTKPRLPSAIAVTTQLAHTMYGKLGIKVWICKGENKPDNKAQLDRERAERAAENAAVALPPAGK